MSSFASVGRNPAVGKRRCPAIIADEDSVLLGYRNVSTAHAELRLEAGGGSWNVVVMDAGSVNGTRRIEAGEGRTLAANEAHVVTSGIVVEFGDARVLVRTVVMTPTIAPAAPTVELEVGAGDAGSGAGDAGSGAGVDGSGAGVDGDVGKDQRGREGHNQGSEVNGGPGGPGGPVEGGDGPAGSGVGDVGAGGPGGPVEGGDGVNVRSARWCLEGSAGRCNVVQRCCNFAVPFNATFQRLVVCVVVYGQDGDVWRFREQCLALNKMSKPALIEKCRSLGVRASTALNIPVLLRKVRSPSCTRTFCVAFFTPHCCDSPNRSTRL